MRPVEFSLAGVAIDSDWLDRPHDVRVSDGLAYVAGKGGSFGIVDVDGMTLLGGLTGFDDAQVVCPVTADRCYVGDENGVHVVDVSDPRTPGVVTSLEREKLRRFNGWDRWGPYLIGASKRGAIGAVRVDEPDRPVLAGSIDTDASPGLRSPHDLRVLDGHALVPDQHRYAGPHVIGVYGLVETADGVRIEPTTFLREPRLGGANRIVLQGDVAYVAGNYGESVGIVANCPDRPTIRSVLQATPGGGPNGLAISNGHLFVPAGGRIEAYDVSTPTAPALAGSVTDGDQFRGGGSIHDLDIEGENLLVTSQYADRLLRYRLDRWAQDCHGSAG